MMEMMIGQWYQWMTSMYQAMHWDAPAASLILQQYVADLNYPCTHKLWEAILIGFGCQVHLQESQDMKLFYLTSICCI